MKKSIEEIYDDFLYDCYLANKFLTEEDWQEYGRERHHIEIPTRDNGLLTPLNSQDLTTYQHWIAGVLQSEWLKKGCFSMIPKGALPAKFETLREKWVKALGKEGIELYLQNTTPEQRSENAKGSSTPEERTQRTKRGWANMSPEDRRARIEKSNCNRSPEAKAEAARKRLEKMTPEKIQEAHQKRMKSTTPEQRSEAARKRWAKLTPEERRLITKNGSEAAAKKAREKKEKLESNHPVNQ